jgi:hypothetical protein
MSSTRVTQYCEENKLQVSPLAFFSFSLLIEQSRYVVTLTVLCKGELLRSLHSPNNNLYKHQEPFIILERVKTSCRSAGLFSLLDSECQTCAIELHKKMFIDLACCVLYTRKNKARVRVKC